MTKKIPPTFEIRPKYIIWYNEDTLRWHAIDEKGEIGSSENVTKLLQDCRSIGRWEQLFQGERYGKNKDIF